MVATRMDPPRLGTLGTRALVDAGTAFELVASALMVADRAGRHRFDEVNLWRRHARSMGATDARTFEGLGTHGVMNLIGLASESPDERNAPDFLALLDSLSPVEIVLNAIGRYRRTILRVVPAEVIEAAVAGDAAAQKRVLTRSWSDVPEWQKALRFLFERPADEVGTAIVLAFRRWYERAFIHEEARLAAWQAREVQKVRAESDTWRLEALLHRVAPALEYLPPAGVDLVTFVPIASIKPAILFLDHRMESIVLYTTADAPAADAPPEALVLLGKALGDELRLRTLRALAGGPRSLSDLAAEVGVPRTSLAHHIAILRAAGFITHTIDDGRWGRLALRPEAIARVEPLFRGFLAAPGSRAKD